MALRSAAKAAFHERGGLGALTAICKELGPFRTLADSLADEDDHATLGLLIRLEAHRLSNCGTGRPRVSGDVVGYLISKGDTDLLEMLNSDSFAGVELVAIEYAFATKSRRLLRLLFADGLCLMSTAFLNPLERIFGTDRVVWLATFYSWMGPLDAESIDWFMARYAARCYARFWYKAIVKRTRTDDRYVVDQVLAKVPEAFECFGNWTLELSDESAEQVILHGYARKLSPYRHAELAKRYPIDFELDRHLAEVTSAFLLIKREAVQVWDRPLSLSLMCKIVSQRRNHDIGDPITAFGEHLSDSDRRVLELVNESELEFFPTYYNDRPNSRASIQHLEGLIAKDNFENVQRFLFGCTGGISCLLNDGTVVEYLAQRNAAKQLLHFHDIRLWALKVIACAIRTKHMKLLIHVVKDYAYVQWTVELLVPLKEWVGAGIVLWLLSHGLAPKRGLSQQVIDWLLVEYSDVHLWKKVLKTERFDTHIVSQVLAHVPATFEAIPDWSIAKGDGELLVRYGHARKLCPIRFSKLAGEHPEAFGLAEYVEFTCGYQPSDQVLRDWGIATPFLLQPDLDEP